MLFSPCSVCQKRLPSTLLIDDKCANCRKRDISITPGPVKCAFCQKPFQPARKWQRFCSTKCSMTFHANASQNIIEDAARIILQKDNEIRDLRAQIEALVREAKINSSSS